MSFQRLLSDSVRSATPGQSEWGRKKASSYVPGQHCGKWSEEEHLKYIVFIDYNKQKMRSKEKRSSNKFYEEMARFISTRNALQCRSHHHKLEERYANIRKIIQLFKTAFNKAHYKRQIELLHAAAHSNKAEPSETSRRQPVSKEDASVQTDLMGTQYELVQVDSKVVVIQRTQQSPQHFYASPSAYYPTPYPSIQYSHPDLSNSYALNPFGWWCPASPGALNL